MVTSLRSDDAYGCNCSDASNDAHACKRPYLQTREVPQQISRSTPLSSSIHNEWIRTRILLGIHLKWYESRHKTLGCHILVLLFWRLVFAIPTAAKQACAISSLTSSMDLETCMSTRAHSNRNSGQWLYRNQKQYDSNGPHVGHHLQ